MKTIAAVLGAVLAVSSLSACSASEGAQSVPDCNGGWDTGVGCPVTIQYEDRDLHCVSWSGSHGEIGLTCDFVRFHAEEGD